MIKSLIIIGLLIVVIVGAALSKPSQDSFVDFYVSQTSGGSGLLAGTLEKAAAKEYAKTFTYNDHLFWADVTKDGKKVFTGAFSHWFIRDASAAKPGLPKF